MKKLMLLFSFFVVLVGCSTSSVLINPNYDFEQLKTKSIAVFPIPDNGFDGVNSHVLKNTLKEMNPDLAWNKTTKARYRSEDGFADVGEKRLPIKLIIGSPLYKGVIKLIGKTAFNRIYRKKSENIFEIKPFLTNKMMKIVLTYSSKIYEENIMPAAATTTDRVKNEYYKKFYKHAKKLGFTCEDSLNYSNINFELLQAEDFEYSIIHPFKVLGVKPTKDLPEKVKIPSKQLLTKLGIKSDIIFIPIKFDMKVFAKNVSSWESELEGIYSLHSLFSSNMASKNYHSYIIYDYSKKKILLYGKELVLHEKILLGKIDRFYHLGVLCNDTIGKLFKQDFEVILKKIL